MKISTLKFFLTFIVMFLSYETFSQQWLKNVDQTKLANGDATFYDYQKAFNDYWDPFNVDGEGWYIDSNGERKKASGYKQFKRAEWFWQYRVDEETGEFPLITSNQQFKKWLNENPQNKTSIAGNWISIGPSNTNSMDFGTGRTNTIAFHPSNNNIFYVAAPSGGLWKTTDHGATWTVLTDQNKVLGISTICLANDFATSNKMFIGTGDKDGGSLWGLNGGQAHDNESIGILKSTDGGVTWTTTSIQFDVNEQVVVSKIIAHPSDNNIFWASTNQALYKSTDGGNTWTAKSFDKFMDIEIKPGDPTTLYASTSVFGTPYPRIYRSVDGGETWAIVLQLAIDQYRIDLAVSAASPAVVYACVSMSDYSGSYAEYGSLYGIYKSTDSGASYTRIFDGTLTNKNLFGWKTNGSDAGGQGDYDMAFCVSPTNANIVYVGGVNAHKSTDGATTFSAMSCWTSSITYNNSGVPIVHADHHYLVVRPSDGYLFDCNDGGLHYSTNSGTSWVDITPGLVNGQIYGIGVAQNVANEVVAGFQDNGTKRVLSGATDWDDVTGGDGMHCAIDYTNNANQYATYAYGQVYRTTNNWSTSSTIRTGVSGSADWAAPLEIDPAGGSILYFADDYVKRYNGAWTTLSQLLTGTSTTDGNCITAMSVYHTGSDIFVYAAGDNGSGWKIWKSPLGGSGTYTDVTGNLPGNAITDIEIDYNDPTHVWVTMGGYDGNRIYETTNSGTTWTNISEGIPQLPAMSVVQYNRNTTEDELYIGMDVGVYVKQGTSPWVLYSGNLPNLIVTDLEFYYGTAVANDILYAATWARGVWKTAPYQCPTLDAAVTDITIPIESYCNFETVNPTIKLANIGTSTLTSATLSYSIDGGAAVNQAWTGSLVNGASVNVSFPAITLTAGSHTITASVSSPNGGTDQVASNNSFTKDYFVSDLTLPYTQNFDDFLSQIGYSGTPITLEECWSNSTTDGTFDWSCITGATPSATTGPDADHTNGLGKYLYTETSGITTVISADLLSPVFNLINYNTADMSFWYHMYGSTMGTFSIDLYYNGSWHTNQNVTWNGTPATSITGDKGNTWFQATLNINAACGYSDVQVRFHRITVSPDATYGDLAIDDFNLTGTVSCIAPTSQAISFTATPSFTSINVGWSGGNGNQTLVVAHQGSAVNQDPASGTSYTANAVFGSGTQIGTGNYVVYNGNSSSVNVTGLSEGTTYYFAIYEFNTADNCYLLTELTGNSTTLISPPSITLVSPNNFFADKGKQLTITGTGLDIVTSVTIGGITGTINSQIATSITVTFPAGYYTNNTLTVINAGGTDTETCTVNKRNTIPVGGGTDFHTTIQSALDGLFAWYGTTSFDAGQLSGAKMIDIYSGAYTENVTPNVTLNPSSTNRLIIQNHTGNSPVIDASGKTNGVYIGTLNYVTISGLSVYNANSDNIYTEGDFNNITFNKSYNSDGASGIKLSASNNSTVKNNQLYNNYNYGIHLVGNISVNVENNTAYGNGHSLAPLTNVSLYPGGIESWETGTTGWAFTGAAALWTRITGDAANSNTGTCHIKFVPGANANQSSVATYSNSPQVNIIGYTSFVVSAYIKSTGMDATYDQLVAEYNIDGLGWNNLFTTTTNYANYTKVSSTAIIATGNVMQIRFTAYSNRTSEPWYIDDIEVKGNEISGSVVGSGLFVESGTGSTIENNILAAKTGSSSYYSLNTGGNTVTSSYNNYFSINPPIYNGTAAVEVAAWTGVGTGDIDNDPLFVSAGSDFHLKSTAGSYPYPAQWPPEAAASAWVLDATTSPSIDAGNTADTWANEPAPNGSRINQGAYGNTAQASKTGCTMPIAPTSVTASSTTICSGANTTLSYTGGSGTTFRWMSASCGGTSVGTGNNLVVAPTVTTTYYGRWENGCGNSTCQSVTITVNDYAVAPTSVSASSTTICEGQSSTLTYSGGSGTTFGWYTTSCGGTLVGNGNNLTVFPTTTTTYYGRWETSCSNSTCQTATVTVNPLPVAPGSVTATSTSICEGQNTTLSYTGGSGSTFRWMTASCGGTSVGTGNNLVVSPTVTTTYYGRWENGCGNSTCQSVTITVTPLPVAPASVTASATTICEGQSTTLSYSVGSGTTFRWMTGSCGGTSVGTGNNLSVSPTVTTTYYGRWETSCGTSTCQTVTVTVNPLPVAPTSATATSTVICNGESSTLLYAGGSGTTFEWYSGSCGGTSVGTGNNLTVSPTVTTTYFGRWETSCGNSTCQSVTITVNDIPSQPSSISGSSTPVVGTSQNYSVTNVPGVSYTWTIPGNWTLNSGQGTNSINVTIGSNSGTVTVTPSNSCGNGTAQTLTVTPSVGAIAWDGSSSNDWQTLSNWTPEQIPTSSDDVVISNGCPNYPLINDGTTTALCNNMTIESSASVTIAVNGQMTVSGTISNSAGNTGLVIMSDASGTGSLIHNSSSGVTATINRYLAATAAQWHLISSPISAAAVSGFPGVNLFNYNETQNDWWTGTTYYFNGSTGWEHPSGNLTVGKGYSYYFYPYTKVFQGTLNYSATGYSISAPFTTHAGIASNGQPYTNFDGWTLAGNPYTSALDWENITTTDDVSTTVNYYDGTIGNYATYQKGGISVNSGTRYIPAMQGFFIKTDDAVNGGNLVVPNAARVHNSQSYWKENEFDNELIKLEFASDNKSDETVIVFNQNATSDYETEYDAIKLFSWDDNTPQIYSMTDDLLTELVINTIGKNETEKIIPLGYKINSESDFTFTIKELINSDYFIYFVDYESNTEVLISENFSYTFTGQPGINNNRFALKFELNKAPQLLTEIPDQSLEIGTTFNYFVPFTNFFDENENDILSFTSDLTTNNENIYDYSFNPLTGEIIFYPQNIGNYQISVTASDLFNKAATDEFNIQVYTLTDMFSSNNNDYIIYPNPSSGKFSIIMNKDVSDYKLYIKTVSGQLVYFSPSNKYHITQVDLSGFAAGLYIITIEYSDGFKSMEKIIIK